MPAPDHLLRNGSVQEDWLSLLPQNQTLHWTYLNAQYNQLVLAAWSEQGCAPEIRKRLGYRLAATRVVYAPVASPGGTLPVEIELVNRGFAAPFNERPALLVLIGSNGEVVHELDVDPRVWHGGAAIEIADDLQLPADLAPGTYSLALWLPDAAPGLADDSRYAIRLANPGVWDNDLGYNVLVDDIVVSDG